MSYDSWMQQKRNNTSLLCLPILPRTIPDHFPYQFCKNRNNWICKRVLFNTIRTLVQHIRALKYEWGCLNDTHTHAQPPSEKKPSCDTWAVPAGNRTQVGSAPLSGPDDRATGSFARREFIPHTHTHFCTTYCYTLMRIFFIGESNSKNMEPLTSENMNKISVKTPIHGCQDLDVRLLKSKQHIYKWRGD